MKIAILYICTGKYEIFWKGFFESCEKFFLVDQNKEFFVFTDAEKLYGEETDPRIHKIFQQQMGWPNDTLKRFHLFSGIADKLSTFDYIFFFNANALFIQPIKPIDILPSQEEKLVAVLHPGYYNQPPSKFTYESKQKASTAYIPKGEGIHYFAGGINGGIAEHYIKLIQALKDNINKDFSNKIIAVWHDESHLNHYLLHRRPKILSPSYIYPEGWDLPFEPIILIRDKSKHGGHNFLRNVQSKKSLKKKIASFIKKVIKR